MCSSGSFCVSPTASWLSGCFVESGFAVGWDKSTACKNWYDENGNTCNLDYNRSRYANASREESEWEESVGLRVMILFCSPSWHVLACVLLCCEEPDRIDPITSLLKFVTRLTFRVITDTCWRFTLLHSQLRSCTSWLELSLHFYSLYNERKGTFTLFGQDVPEAWCERATRHACHIRCTVDLGVFSVHHLGYIGSISYLLHSCSVRFLFLPIQGADVNLRISLLHARDDECRQQESWKDKCH